MSDGKCEMGLPILPFCSIEIALEFFSKEVSLRKVYYEILIQIKAVSSFCQNHYVKSKHLRPSTSWFSQVTKILLLSYVRFTHFFFLF